jgi:hypothetical protein
MTGPTAEDPPSRTDRRTLWLSVAGSIIASIIFAIFFQPVTTFVSDITVTTIGVFYRGYVDSLYREATINPTDSLIYMVFAIVVMFPGLVFIAIGIARIASRAGLRKRPRSEIIGRVLSITLGINTLFLAIIASGPYVSIRANASFQRRMMALTPAISEQERKELFGKWAIMKSRADYDGINEQMESLATKVHQELPKRLQ